MKGLKAGNEKAYEYIYTHYYALLCRFANQLLGDSLLAEEIVDDVIFNLWKNRAQLDVAMALRAYLLVSVRNRCLSELKSLNARHSSQTLSMTVLDGRELFDKVFVDEAHPLGSLLERELEDKIRDAIGHLPESCREVFLRSRVKQATYEEIAEEMNISTNTVKYHIKNALSQLREQLKEYLEVIIIFFLISY